MDSKNIRVDRNSLYDIANAIREKNKETTTYLASEMGGKIRELDVVSDHENAEEVSF